MKQFNYMTWIVVLALSLGVATLAEDGVDADSATAGQRFRAAEHVAGAGFYWVDTMSGQLWLMDATTMSWIDCGVPAQATPSAIGTYIPYRNKSGSGIFILNTTTGQGWWCNAGEWKELGVPGASAHRDSE